MTEHQIRIQLSVSKLGFLNQAIPVILDYYNKSKHVQEPQVTKDAQFKNYVSYRNLDRSPREEQIWPLHY